MVCDWNDVDDSFVASHLSTRREFCSRMKRYSPSNKPTIIRTAGAGAPNLPARLLSSNTAKIQSLWFRARICATGKTLLVFVDEVEKLAKPFTAVTSWTPWWFLLPVATSVDSNGSVNKIGSSPQSESDAGVVQGPFFRLYHSSEEWRPYSPDLNHRDYSIWSILKARALLSPTNIWRVWSSRCSGGGTDCRQKSCSMVLNFRKRLQYAVYWSRKRSVWSKLNMLFTKLFVIVTNWQHFFVLLNKLFKTKFMLSRFLGSPWNSKG